MTIHYSVIVQDNEPTMHKINISSDGIVVDDIIIDHVTKSMNIPPDTLLEYSHALSNQSMSIVRMLEVNGLSTEELNITLPTLQQIALKKSEVDAIISTLPIQKEQIDE